MTEERLRELFERWLIQQASKEEELELWSGLNDPTNAQTIRSLIDESWDQLPATFKMSGEQADHIFDQILSGQKPNEAPVNVEVPVVKIKSKIFTLRRISIAASILLAIGSGTYFFTRSRVSKATENQPIVKQLPNIQAPTTTHAIITLAGGKQIIIDSAGAGSLASQGTINISKLNNGEIAYTGSASKEIEYNTLINPRGSRVVTITLNDGTRVWLNAESSIKYPTAFTGNDRPVEITGEAYFEVAHNPKKPFLVTTRSSVNGHRSSIEVLGTHFNINAYDDEASIKVTLLEGSVKINNKTIIKPGQQAIIEENKTSVNDNVDLANVIAWKNGKFDFGARADLQQIMREIGRWYDIEVVYQGNIPAQKFGGEMPRSSDLNQVLEILKTSGVKFSVEGKKLIVMP